MPVTYGRALLPVGLQWVKGGSGPITAIAGIDQSGATDNTSTIQTAWNAAAAGTRLGLPPGTDNIRVDSHLLLGGTDKTLTSTVPGQTAGLYRAGLTTGEFFQFSDGAARNVLDSVVCNGFGTGLADHPGGYAQLNATYATQKGVIFFGATQCAVTNATMKNCGGDGFAFSDDTPGNTTPQQCVVANVTSTHNGGSGSSCNRVNNALYYNYTTTLCGQLGIDIEPNGTDAGETVTNLEVATFSIGAYSGLIYGHGTSGVHQHDVSHVYIHDGTFTASPYVAAPNWPITTNYGGANNQMSAWFFQRITLGFGVALSPYGGIDVEYVTNVTVDSCDFSAATSGLALARFTNCQGNIVVSNNTLGTHLVAYNDNGGNGTINSFGNHA